MIGFWGLHHPYICYRFHPFPFISNEHYPLVMNNSLLWKIAIETVDLPIENGDFPWFTKVEVGNIDEIIDEIIDKIMLDWGLKHGLRQLNPIHGG